MKYQTDWVPQHTCSLKKALMTARVADPDDEW